MAMSSNASSIPIWVIALGDRGSYLIFDPEPEDGLLIIFETNRRSVTSFRSGFDQQVRYIEGCA
jgi:hypothetical protein